MSWRERLQEDRSSTDLGIAAMRAALRDRDPGDVDPAELSRHYRLRFVSLEANTVCNHACWFCPVSTHPREEHTMSEELYGRIIGQLVPHRETIDAVFMNNYNEPTVDRGFLSRVEMIKDAGLPPAILSNGSGMTPPRARAVAEAGGVRHLAINLHTLDPQRFADERGVTHLDLVVKNIDAMAELPMAESMVIVVLGRGDAEHQADVEAIRERFGGERFEVNGHVVDDRAGNVGTGHEPPPPIAQLRGCSHLGSRPIEHIHITAHGKAVLCCEDYFETQVVGDLNTETVDEVMAGDALALRRRWTYGLQEAPDDYICRSCQFALGE